MENKKVTVYCAASDNIDNYYLKSAEELGKGLAKHNYTLVYGGGEIGMMGKVSNGVIQSGGKSIGVIPDFMMGLELGNEKVDELIIVPDMHKRQDKMLKLADAVVSLPGGCGTFVELMEAITWKRLGLIIAPIIIVNLKNYFDPIIEMLNKAVDEKFMREEHRKLWEVANTIDEAFEKIKTIKPFKPKKIV